jgi:hypothetical protein
LQVDGIEAWQVPKLVALDVAETVFELLAMDVAVVVEWVNMAAGWSCDQGGRTRGLFGPLVRTLLRGNYGLCAVCAVCASFPLSEGRILA